MASDHDGQRARPARRSSIILFITLALLVVPVLVDLVCHDTSLQKRLFAYTAPDTFYYLTVARNIGLHGRFSFDGEHLSNGYHPFWQVLTAVPYALRLPGTNSPWILAYLLGMAIALQSAAFVWWSRIFRRDDGTLSWLFVGLPAGIYAIWTSPAWFSLSTAELTQQNLGEGAQPVYGSQWSYLNGMETSLVLFFFAWISWLATRERPLERPIALGLALVGLVFARLDHIFIAFPILVGLSAVHMCRMKSWRERLRAPAMALGIFVLPIVVYLLLNHFFVGSALPTSGRVKSTFPFITDENFNVLTSKYIHNMLQLKPIRIDDHWRCMQIVLPTVCALLTPLVVLRARLRHGHLIVGWAGPHPRRGALLLMTAVGVLCLGAYDFFFVLVYSIGHWYVPVSTLFCSLVCLHLAERMRHAWLTDTEKKLPGPRLVRFAKYALPALAVTITAGLFVAFQRMPNYHAKYAEFAVELGPDLRRFLQEKNAKIIDCDDGIIAWVSNVPAMSATGLGLDPEAVKARRSESGLMKLAMERQYTYAATLVYVGASRPRANTPTEVSKWMRTTGAFTQLKHLDDYAWRIAYHSADKKFIVVHATPLPKASPQMP